MKFQSKLLTYKKKQKKTYGKLHIRILMKLAEYADSDSNQHLVHSVTAFLSFPQGASRTNENDFVLQHQQGRDRKNNKEYGDAIGTNLRC